MSDFVFIVITIVSSNHSHNDIAEDVFLNFFIVLFFFVCVTIIPLLLSAQVWLFFFPAQ